MDAHHDDDGSTPDAVPKDAPFFRVGCWAILEANRKCQAHRTLDEWGAGIEE